MSTKEIAMLLGGVGYPVLTWLACRDLKAFIKRRYVLLISLMVLFLILRSFADGANAPFAYLQGMSY